MYNFDKKIERKNTNCTKYDGMTRYFGRDDLYPLWVADMDFQTPAFICQDIKERVNHPIYGYGELNKELYDSIILWQRDRYNWKIKEEEIEITTSVVASISCAIEAFSNIDDEVIVFTPVWDPFYNIVKQNGRKIVKIPLIKNKKYEMDFQKIEKAISNKTKLILFCSPHNPIGRVWNKDELIQLGKIALKYNLKIISDEIHSDLSFKKFKPLAKISKKISDITITLNSPTKSFNLAGLNISYVICKNKVMLDSFSIVAKKRGITNVNIFATVALISAYNKGSIWLNEVKKYIKKNISYMKKYLKKNIPTIKFNKVEATYLVWLDFNDTKLSHNQIDNILKNDLKLGLMDGKVFDNKLGDKYFRINVAIPKNDLKSVLKTLLRYNGKNMKGLK